MDRRIMFAVLGVAALALAGLAFAAGGQGWNVTGVGQQSWNGAAQGHRMMRGQGDENATGGGMMHCSDGNGMRVAPPNMTAVADAGKKFAQAVLSDDYSTAKSLSGEYGFGGPVFDRLNGTTFAKFSQIAKLESQLETELGLNATGMMPPRLDKPGFGMRQGMKERGGAKGPEFAKGMRHGFGKNTNQTTQQ